MSLFQQPPFGGATPTMGFNYNAPQMIERGALAVRQKHDFFRNLWGVPEDLARMMEGNNNMQAMDIIGQYKDRALQIPSSQLTAAILNGEASWLSDTAAPIFPTAEFNFQSQFKEMNQIEFTRTAVGGIPNEQTYRTTSWKDTIEKVQLNARLEMDLSLDPNFGEDQWLFQLAGLASNAMLTIHKSIAYSIIHIAYTNAVGDHVKHGLNPYDLSRALAWEEETFGVAALDQTRYLRMIRRMRDKIIDFDTVIIPHNAVNYLAELKGESTSMVSQKVQMDPVTQQLQWKFCEGKKSVLTVTYGDEVMHFVEMPQFRINMARDASKEQVMRTSVTVAQAIQVDPDVKIDVLDTGAMKQENLDVYVFNQTKNQGEEAKISITDAYAAAFYWDESNSCGNYLNDHVHSYLRYKNSQVQQDTVPWRYNQANGKRDLKKQGINDETGFDYNTPNLGDLVNKENLLDMRGWRDEYFGLIYLPDKKEYRIPKRIVDFSLDVMPNRAIHKCAKAIAHVANVMSSHGMDFDGMMKEFYNLMADIDNSPWSDEWIVAVVNANIERMYDFNNTTGGGESKEIVDSSFVSRNSNLPTFNPATKKPQVDEEGKPSLFSNATPLQEWRGDRFGSLNLPRKNGRITQTYPPGFGSGPGLLRLAQEADDDTSEWREVGQRAKRVVAFLEMLDSLFREYIGPTDLNDESLTSPWFHVNSSIAVLVDSLRHYKSPVFLAVPQQANISADVSPSQLKKIVTEAMLGDIVKFKSDSGVATTSTIISSLTKYAVIMNADSDQEKGTVFIQKVDNSPLKGYQTVIHKLIDFTIKTVYNQPGSEFKHQMTLDTIDYIANKIFGASNEQELSAANELLETVVNIGDKNKKAEGAKLLETIKKIERPDRTKEVNDAVLRMRERETQLRSQGTKLEKGKVSYDVQVQALNDYNRLSVNNTDNARLVAATEILTNSGIIDDKGVNSRSSSARASISLDLSNPTPLTFLRSPLVSGDNLMEYMQRSSNPLIRPSDPAVFHEAPLDIINEDTLAHPVFYRHKKGARVPCVALPYSQIFKHGLSGMVSLGAPTNNDFSRRSNTKKTYSSSRSRDIGDFIGYGLSRQPREEFDDVVSPSYTQKRSKAPQYQRRDGQSEEDYRKSEAEFKQYLSEEEYIGPIESREEYISTISSLFERVIFKAIMLAPNRIIIHNKLAVIGQKLVNVLIFRLFIQHIMSSTIVMKAGHQTIKTAVGHGKVWCNSEQRGYNTINAGFYLGTVRVNPNGIQMIPHTFPEAFVGGMGITFMKDKTHFRNRTNDKESMIAMITPITENRYVYPIHLLNLPTYKSRDIESAPFLRKWSSYEYFSHVFGYNMLCDVQGQIEEAKRHYGHAFDISLCAHRSPVRYLEGNGRQRLVQGSGCRGNIRMNITGAESTWSGSAVSFPDYSTDLQRRQ